MVLCEHPISFPPISVNGTEKKTYSDLWPFLLFGNTLSYRSTSAENAVFQVFHTTEDSTQHYVFYQFMLPSLSFNESFSNATNKKTAGGFFPTNDTPRLFLFHSRYDVSVFHLPHVQPTAQGRQTVNQNPGSSHWRRTFANFRSAVMEHHSSGLFLGLISPAVFLLSGYVSSITGDLNNIRSIAFLGLIHGVAEVID